MTTLATEAYRIAELAHKGVDDDYIHDECDQAAIYIVDQVVTSRDVYRASERAYAQHFESR